MRYHVQQIRIKSVDFFEYLSAIDPAIGAMIKYPIVRTEKITPISLPVALISVEATNGIRKSRKKNPRLFSIVILIIELKSWVKPIGVNILIPPSTS
jgi:hypothetical protein